MDFSKLNDIANKKKVVDEKAKRQFNAHAFLNKADNMLHQIDSYFLKEPLDTFDAIDKFEISNDINSFEMEISAPEILRKFL